MWVLCVHASVACGIFVFCAVACLLQMGMVLVDDSVYPFKSKKGENLQCQGGL